MQPIIEIKNIGKQYMIGEKQPYLALRDTLSSLMKNPARWFANKTRSAAETEAFWALKDVSFNVMPGEVVGVIGRNGAGKSTLLKILSQITPPTAGEIVMRGRVGSLLEVGTGFHPELTGEENIYLNGAILGMRRKEIKKKFDEIVEFAGVNKFLDTPVKRYSSGMYVRLAFSVAAYLESEILLVDEVLAVGDAEFQKKCLGKMEDVTKKEGRTVIFVSHNMGAIRSLCNRCALIDHGTLKEFGDTPTVTENYFVSGQMQNAVYTYPENKNKKVQIRSIKILDHSGQPNSQLDVNLSFKIAVEYIVSEDLDDKNFTYIMMNDLNGNILLHTYDIDSNEQYYLQRKKGHYTSVFNFPAGFLNVQTCEIIVGSGVNQKHALGKEAYFDRKDGIDITFVNPSNFATKVFSGRRDGSLLMRVPCEISKLE